MARAALIGLLVVSNPTRGHAVEWGGPNRYVALAENGRFEFRVTPSKDWSTKFGACRGALYARDDSGTKLRWERMLINNTCPIRSFPSNACKYVVTVGEWVYYEHLPFVIYAVDGCLINVYGDFRQLVPYYLGHMSPGRVSGKGLPSTWWGRDWLHHSLLFFGPSDHYFIVRLSNAEVLVFQTETGRLVDDQWREENRIFPSEIKQYDELRAKLPRLISREAHRLASSGDRDERDDGLFVLGQIGEAVGGASPKSAVPKEPRSGGHDTSLDKIGK
jgi:hypothetical protein